MFIIRGRTINSILTYTKTNISDMTFKYLSKYLQNKR